MKAKTPTYHHAHRLIIDHLLQFAMSRVYIEGDHKRHHPGSVGFFPATDNSITLKPGDLVLVTSAPASKWRLSWLVEQRQFPNGDWQYALASIEDREECWWSNIGIAYLERNELECHQNWRWNDEEYEFNAKWFEACRREDAYIYLPVPVRFVAGYQAEIGVRTRYSINDKRPVRTIADYRKATFKSLRALYIEMCEESKNQEKKS